MEGMEMLDQLEDIIEGSKTVPLLGKAMIDKDELLDIIQELRLKMPDDLKQAKWIKGERQRILLEAQKEATAIIKSAEDKIISMINENEITKKANEEKIAQYNAYVKDINKMVNYLVSANKYGDAIKKLLDTGDPQIIGNRPVEIVATLYAQFERLNDLSRKETILGRLQKLVYVYHGSRF